MRKELTGMLPGAIEIFETLLDASQDLDCVVRKGYDCEAGQGSLFYWGCAVQVTCPDMMSLRSRAESLGITWLDDDGSMAYTKGLAIKDFKTFRVNGNLEVTPGEEE